MPTKVNVNGKLRDAEVVDVVESARPWADFLLADGTRLRMNVVVDTVYRLVGEFDARGNPIYYTNARTVASTISPEEMMKRD